jgi:hypothetical protein
MFMAVGAASGVLSTLQSLLAQGTAGIGSTDPLSSLLGAVSGAASDGDTPKAPASSTGSATPAQSFDTSTMAALISLQDQSGPQGSSPLFAKLDADGNGQVSKSEFETTLGNAGVDQSSADALFDKLDANGDGSIDQSELSKARHGGHHHHRMHADGSSGQGGLASLMSGAGVTGATSQTTSNADGSSTTTITYADGSKVEMTSPATPSDSGNTGAGTGGPSAANLIERLIQMQAQLVNAATSTVSTVA